MFILPNIKINLINTGLLTSIFNLGLFLFSEALLSNLKAGESKSLN